MSYLDSRIIILNSAHGRLLNGTYKSDIEFQFNGLLKQEDDIQQVQISLVNAQIPVSWYIINYTNNVFTLQLGNNITKTYYISVGNYNANSLITALNTLINDSNFSITISKITGKLTFTYNTTFTIYSDNNYSICSILGFDINTVYNCNFSFICPYPLNLLGYKRLEIYSQLQTYNYSSLNNGMCTLLSIIPIDQPSYSLITYNNFTDTKNIIKNKTLDKIEILIKGEDENFINFNNIDWTMKLKIDITRQYIISDNIPNENNKKDIKNLKSDDIIQNDIDLLTYN